VAPFPSTTKETVPLPSSLSDDCEKQELDESNRRTTTQHIEAMRIKITSKTNIKIY
jgi:hypothetical protein